MKYINSVKVKTVVAFDRTQIGGTFITVIECITPLRIQLVQQGPIATLMTCAYITSPTSIEGAQHEKCFKIFRFALKNLSLSLSKRVLDAVTHRFKNIHAPTIEVLNTI